MAKEIKAKAKDLRLKAIFLIVDWDKLGAVSKALTDEKCSICYVSKGRGTASSELLDMLGIGSTDKAVIFCFAEHGKMLRLVQAVRRVMGFQSAGAGIAFSVPLSGMNAVVMKMFEDIQIEDEATHEVADEAKKKETFMASLLSPKESVTIKNDMIIAVLNAGYSDAFMTAARKAGSRGGTVINARGLSTAMVKKFLGISVLEEKEIIIILAQNDVKVPIMQAISAGFGTATKAAGLIFSLPVDQVMSLNEMI